MKLKTLLVLSTSMVVTSTAFAAGWEKPIPVTQDLIQDGTTAQYLYNPETGVFMLGANDYKTRASVSTDMGFRWKISSTGEGTVALTDSLQGGNNDKTFEWRKMFCANAESIWVDNNTGDNCDSWTLTSLGNGKYKIGNTAFADSYLGVQKDLQNTRLFLSTYFTEKSIEGCYEWTGVSESEYDAWFANNEVYALAVKLDEAIKEAKKAYPSIDLAAEEAVYNNTASTKDELQAAIDAIPAKLKAAAAADMSGATLANPKDATALIKNSTFDKIGDFTGWEGSGFGAGGTTSTAAERWNTNYDTYQTIKDLPIGVYKVNVDGMYRAGDTPSHDWSAFKKGTDNNAKVYGANVTANGDEVAMANIMHLFEGVKPGEHLDADGTNIGGAEYVDGEDKYYVPASMLDFTNLNGTTKTLAEGTALYKTNSVMFPVSEGTAKIGIKKDVLITNDWTIVDNFCLTYYGNQPDAWAALMKDYAGNIPAVEGTVTKSVVATFDDAKNNAVATDYASYKAAITKLDEAKKLVDENVAAWAKFKSIADQADLLLKDKTYQEIATELSDYLSYDYDEFIKNLELSTEEINAEIKTLQDLYDEAKSATPAGTDVTSMLKNNNFAQGWEGWSHTGEGGNVAVNANAKCAEAWNSKNFDIHQDIENAPVGVYKIEVQGFYRYNNGDDTGWMYYFNEDGSIRTDHNDYIKSSPAYIYMNDAMTPLDNIYKFKKEYDTENPFYKTEGLAGPQPYVDPNKEFWYPNDMTNAGIAFDAGAYVQNAVGLVAKKGDPLRIGVKGSTNEGTSWCIFTRFKLTYMGYDAAVIKPELEKAIASINADATMGSDIAAEVKKAIAEGKEALNGTEGKKMFNALAAIYALQNKAKESEKLFADLIAKKDAFREAVSNNSEDARPAVAKNAAQLLLDVESAIEGKTYTDAQATEAISNMAKMSKKLMVPATIDTASDENPVDVTGVIANNSFENGDLSGWNATQNSADTGSKDNGNATYTVNNADGSYVFNTWNSSAVEGGFYVSQDLEDLDLPAGTYELKALVASDADLKQTLSANSYAVETTTTDKAEGVEASVIFKIEENEKITIKIASETWFKCDNFQLTYYGANSSKEITSGVENIIATPAAAEIHTIGGVKVSTLQKGINIVRTANGVIKVTKK